MHREYMELLQDLIRQTAQDLKEYEQKASDMKARLIIFNRMIEKEKESGNSNREGS